MFFIGASKRVLIINVFFALTMLILNVSMLINRLTELIIRLLKFNNLESLKHTIDSLIDGTKNNKTEENETNHP